MRLTVVSSLCILLSLVACEEKKTTPGATPAASAETPAEGSGGQKSVVAYPPGYVPPADAGAAPHEAKTGICSFQDNSFDGQDTRSNEKMVVRIKEDKIVAAEYRYRGSYAIDGKSESLNVPVKQNEWVEFDLPMTNGTRPFKARLKGTDMDLKGVAASDASADCVWKMEDQDEDPDLDAGDTKGKKKGDKKKTR
jgi:major membrane immunogen (membrane-anchored lipoprotein)